MTFEKTIVISVVFHLVLMAFLSVSWKRNFFQPPAIYQVTLVASRQSASATLSGGAAGKEPAQRVKEASPEKPAPALMPSRAEKVPSQVVEPEKTLADIKQERLAKIEGMTRVKKRVRLKEDIIVGGRAEGPAEGQPAGGGNPELDAFIEMLVSRVMKEWFFPDVKSTGLEAVVLVVVLRDGTLLINDFEKRSGNQVFDQSAIRALERVKRVEPPPFELEFGLRFNPDK